MRSFVFFVALVGCAPTPPPPAAAAVAPPPAEAAAPTSKGAAPSGFVIVAGKITSDGGSKITTLHADGKVDTNGQHVLTITPDGRALDPGGKEIARIDSHGNVTPGGYNISDEGTVRSGRLEMEIRGGYASSPDAKWPKIAFEPESPSGRRALVFVFRSLR
jgi:hypothetical protein